MELYDWILNAINSGIDTETKIRVYVYAAYVETGKDELVTGGTINEVFKDCRVDDALSEATIHNWYAWAKDDIVINLNDDPYESRFVDDDDMEIDDD